MQALIECVPNFSEGRNMQIIEQILDEIRLVEAVKLIDVDPGKATNRTVVTFVGAPDDVCEAAFRAVKKAAVLIDMRKHKGEHPRFGTTDVLPLIPIKGISMEQVAEYARKLAERIGLELDIPCYCYENAATDEKRRNLANCREGEYEALPKKLNDAAWKPDYGPAQFNESVAKTGATAVGARNFLIAYNVNLNTTSTRFANAIAFDIREKGRIKREGNPLTGKIVRDADGNPVYTPGLLKAVKGIGWFIEEYGIAQLSFNITDTTQSSMHQVFETACERAALRGVRVTGSELVGVVPLQFMLDAGKYFLQKQHRSVGIPDSEIIKIAVKSLGLDELYPFDPQKKIIEYLIDDADEKKLVDLSLKKFSELTASESAAPGGGSVSAAMGAMGVALGAMVANLSSHKRGWDERWLEFSNWAESAKLLYSKLLQLVDDDTRAFNAVMDAFAMSQSTTAEKLMRSNAIEAATLHAALVPLEIMKVSFESMELLKQMALVGNPNSVSDAGVGALAVRAAVHGAALNVRINAAQLKNDIDKQSLTEQAHLLELQANEKETEIIAIVKAKI